MRSSLLAVLLFSVSALAAFGWGGPIQGPMLPAGRTDKPATDSQFSRVFDFMTKELKFLEGSFINECTSQTFAGTSAQTAKFVALAKESEAWEVELSFADFKEQKSALRIASDGSSGKLHVIVNSGREDFLLKDFLSLLPLATPPKK